VFLIPSLITLFDSLTFFFITLSRDKHRWLLEVDEKQIRIDFCDIELFIIKKTDSRFSIVSIC